MDDLKDKVAVVTGASSGIGASIAKELLQSGMKVVGLARRKEKIEELGKGFEGKLFAVRTDVTKEDDILKAFEWIESNVGPVSVLVNNAGIYDVFPIEEADTASVKKTLDTNLLAVTIFTREAVKSMKENNIDGFIININSTWGHYITSLPGYSMYTVSKHGVTAFTESIRLELANSGSKIRLTNFSPGLVKTELAEPFLNGNPYIETEDIAQGVKYILSQPKNVNVAQLTLRPTAEFI